MLPDHGGFAQSLDAREFDELALHHFQHGRTRDAHEAGDEERAQRDDWQDVVRRSAHAPGRQPAQLDAEDEDQQDAQPEARHGDTQHRDRARRAVEHAATVDRRHHAQGNAEHHAQQDRPRDEHERVGQAVEEGLGRRLLHADRHAEIAVHRLADEDRILVEDRTVEAERLGERRTVLGRGVLGQHQVDRIARQPAQEEHDRRHHEEQDHALHQAARDVALHAARAIVCAGLTSSRASAPGAGCAQTHRPARDGRRSHRTDQPSWC